MMKKYLLPAFAAALIFGNGVAGAAVIASVGFTNPTGTAGAADTIDIWMTLSLDAASDPLTYDEGDYPFAGLPMSLIPTEAEVWNGNGFDYIPFDSYNYVGKFTHRSCTGTFTDGCSDGEYSLAAVTTGANTWFGTSELNLLPGESQDFLIYRLTPTDGSALPGSYELSGMGLGFTVFGEDEFGAEIEQDIDFGGSCPLSTCTFTRTVAAVPVPAAVWLFGSGLIGMIGFVRQRKK